MFKSIRTKLSLSFLLVILMSMAVTGIFFQWRMKSELEDSLVRETLAQAKVAAGTISSLSEPKNIIGQADLTAGRYTDDPGKVLRVYSVDGRLIADSQLPKVGSIVIKYDDTDVSSPGSGSLIIRYDSLDTIFPPDPAAKGESTAWRQPLPDGRIIVHGAAPLGEKRTDAEVIGSSYPGALILSEILKADLPEEDYKKAEERLKEEAGKISEEFNAGYKGDKEFKVQAETLTEGLKNKKFRTIVANESFEILATSDTLQKKEIANLPRGESIHWFETTPAGRTLYVAVPIVSSVSANTRLGSLILSTSLKSIDATYNQLLRVLMYAVGISLALTVIVALVLAGNLIKPITEIESVSRDIAAGNFDTYVEYQGNDEMKSLADTINYMAARIKSNVRQITDEKDKMDALLAALPDGVIALDKESNVLFRNRASTAYLKATPGKITSSSLFELWPEEEIKTFFEEAQDKSGLYSKEVSLPPRFLRLHLIPYGGDDDTEGGMMMVVQDVTDLRRLEETRTRFLGSISHELRTPLTIIKGFIHTIIDDEPIKSDEMAHHALEIIDSETDRLTRLVNDLLELSRLRSKKLSMDMETINVGKMVEDTVRLMAPNAERAGIELTLHRDDNDVEIFADRDRMKQVIINLIDNGVKYTPGEGKVTVRTYLEERPTMIDGKKGKVAQHWVFEVEDTGMGISKDELPFLFERFFRTMDKKKKKYIKGTGLGMAIVKEIIDAHGGIIDVESHEGKGTIIHTALPVEREEE